MIRIDEIYSSVFYPKISSNPHQSMHYFDPFGRTDVNALMVQPLLGIDDYRDVCFLFWDQEPFYDEYHTKTLNHFHRAFVRPIHPRGPNKGKLVEHNVSKVRFVTSEKNSKSVTELCKEYEYVYDYYFFHGWAALDWYRGYNRTNLIPEYKSRNITNTFISPNRIVGGNRHHRIDLFKSMVKNNLIENNKISFPKVCPYSNEEIKIEGVQLPLVFENDTDVSSNISSKINLWEQSKDSLLQVVTETVYEQDTLHLTEKIFKPIVMQMPFVLVGAKNNLEYLRSYGFKTFGEFWNEDYDNDNNETRLTSITQLITDLNSQSLNEKRQLQKHLNKIVEHNFNWFYSREFEDLLWKELTTTIAQW